MADAEFPELSLVTDRSEAPFILPWPMPGNIGAWLSFEKLADWRAFVARLGLASGIPQIVAAKFGRAQRLYFLAWIDFDLIKAGELVALTALELAIKDQYGAELRKRQKRLQFPELLKHMVEVDGLTDEQLPLHQRCGGPIVSNLYESDARKKERLKMNGGLTLKTDPPHTLVSIRNAAAHGDPFDAMPYAGLLELVRDLIHYAYRDRLKL
jgi:hypothetical protein